MAERPAVNVFDQMDALMRRHREPPTVDNAIPVLTDMVAHNASHSDDVPLLTEVAPGYKPVLPAAHQPAPGASNLMFTPDEVRGIRHEPPPPLLDEVVIREAPPEILMLELPLLPAFAEVPTERSALDLQPAPTAQMITETVAQELAAAVYDEVVQVIEAQLQQIIRRQFAAQLADWYGKALQSLQAEVMTEIKSKLADDITQRLSIVLDQRGIVRQSDDEQPL